LFRKRYARPIRSVPQVCVLKKYKDYDRDDGNDNNNDVDSSKVSYG
jgi:hypothetical protein